MPVVAGPWAALRVALITSPPCSPTLTLCFWLSLPVFSQYCALQMLPQCVSADSVMVSVPSQLAFPQINISQFVIFSSLQPLTGSRLMPTPLCSTMNSLHTGWVSAVVERKMRVCCGKNQSRDAEAPLSGAVSLPVVAGGLGADVPLISCFTQVSSHSPVMTSWIRCSIPG